MPDLDETQRNLVVAMAQGYRQVGAFTGDQYATVRADALDAILADARRFERISLLSSREPYGDEMVARYWIRIKRGETFREALDRAALTDAAPTAAQPIADAQREFTPNNIAAAVVASSELTKDDAQP